MKDLKKIAGKLGVYATFEIMEKRFIGDDPESASDYLGQIVESIARCHELVSDAAASVAIANRDYRAWRAESALAILDAEPKLAQWKIDARLNSDPTFIVFKTELTERSLRLDTLRGYAQALDAKAAFVTALLR